MNIKSHYQSIRQLQETLHLFFLLAIVQMLFNVESVAQTSESIVAKGSCNDSVVVVSPVTFQLWLWHHEQIVSSNGPCYHIVWGLPMTPKYRLQKFNEGIGAWEWHGPEQSSGKFTGLGTQLGTYRVIARLPVIVENNMCLNGYETVHDPGGRHIGFRGLYKTLPPSNIVIVGQPTGQDNQFTFVDGNGILLFGNDPSLPIFDAQEDWKIDVSASKNYNQWLLNMYKKDPPNNLPWASYLGGWQLDGPPANPVIDIAHWWTIDNNYPFDPSATYVVQWVATNKDCPNWNVNEKEAYICPSGFNCRFGITTTTGEEEVVLYPNPVATSFYLSGSQSVARMELMDSYGRQKATWAAGSGSYDLPAYIPSGAYYLRLFDGQNAMLKTIGVQVAR